MRYIVFPRPIWHLIIEHLSYWDRCTLRLVCKWLSLNKNQNPLKYWIIRNDPIVLNLGAGLIHAQARCGLFVVSKRSKYSHRLNKNITIGGNFESLKRYLPKNKNYLRYTTALKHGHTELITLEQPSIMSWQKLKYNYMCGNFLIDEDIIFSNQYCIALKYGAPEKILKKIGKNLSMPDKVYAYLLLYVFNNNVDAADTSLRNYNKNVKINCYELLNIACKNNSTEMVKVLLNYPRGSHVKKLRFNAVCKLGDDDLILQILQSLSASCIKKCLIYAIRNGNLFAVKKIILCWDLSNPLRLAGEKVEFQN